MVDLAGLQRQIYKVEGINIDVVQFVHSKKKVLDKLRYPEYPYTEKFNGPIEQLVPTRIVPILEQEVIEE